MFKFFKTVSELKSYIEKDYCKNCDKIVELDSESCCVECGDFI